MLLMQYRGNPNAMMIIYPGYLSGGPNHSLTPELKATIKNSGYFYFSGDG